MKRTILVLLATVLPGLAHGAGGGGAFAELQYLPRYGPAASPHEAPGFVRCLGGVGYGVTSSHLRIGGEGARCGGSDGDVRMTYGGAQVGTWVRPGWLYWSFYSSLGFGAMVDEKVLDVQEDPYTSVFFYAKPTLTMGLPLAFVGVEIGVFAHLPLNLVQIVGSGHARGFVTPTFGAQVAVMLGNFRDPGERRHERYDAPVPPPPAIQPPPPPVDTGWCDDCTIPEVGAPCDGPDCARSHDFVPCANGDTGPGCEPEAPDGQQAPPESGGDRPLAIPVP